ncbi:hypothetical protein GJV26_09060 [Massilia dura]|uniref:Uncharacterized protein n=1 Tax=Pseudoduganella dura TaxID=321982 RepID=A0A6I3XJ32_9BURK|nr:hypothetical protein [Pseudoduganella dura]MUI12618.1 hypothetical protein [Pseudoduganella dura]GGY17282.1 hypothetical protein GCM10007386_53800 [Pseudoduganella dura]
MDGLEKKLWFVALVSLLATFATGYLIDSAGLPGPAAMNASQAMLYFLSFGACWKLFSFGGWLLALCFHTPACTPDLTRNKRR